MKILLVVLVLVGIVSIVALSVHLHGRAQLRKQQQIVCINLSRQYELTPEGPERLAVKRTLEAAGCMNPPSVYDRFEEYLANLAERI